MTQDNGQDGFGGTDDVAKVIHLFGGPVHSNEPVDDTQFKLVELLERLAGEAASGRITGIALVAFMPTEQFKVGVYGRIRYSSVLGALEDLKFQVLKQGPSYK